MEGTIVSSDREKLLKGNSEKLKCWKVLAQVEQYVLQDKRDAKKVAERLQSIINEPLGRLLFSNNYDQEFIDNIKKRTISGELKWNLVSRPYVVDDDDLESNFENLEIIISKPKHGESNSLRIYNGPGMPAHGIELSAEDKQFFNIIFKFKNDQRTVEHKGN